MASQIHFKFKSFMKEFESVSFSGMVRGHRAIFFFVALYTIYIQQTSNRQSIIKARSLPQGKERGLPAP